MTLKHPCKKCIVKGACSKRCNNIKNYSKQFESVFFMIAITIIPFVSIYGLYILIGYLFPYTTIFLIETIVFAIIFIISSLFFNVWFTGNGFKEFKDPSNYVFLILSQSILITVGIINLAERHVAKHIPKREWEYLG